MKNLLMGHFDSDAPSPKSSGQIFRYLPFPCYNIKARLKEVLVLFIERIQQMKSFSTSASVLQKQKFSKMLEPKYANGLRVKCTNLNV